VPGARAPAIYQIRGGAFYLVETMESRSVKTPP
jgi:hypothetical protein